MVLEITEIFSNKDDTSGLVNEIGATKWSLWKVGDSQDLWLYCGSQPGEITGDTAGTPSSAFFLHFRAALSCTTPHATMM